MKDKPCDIAGEKPAEPLIPERQREIAKRFSEGLTSLTGEQVREKLRQLRRKRAIPFEDMNRQINI